MQRSMRMHFLLSAPSLVCADIKKLAPYVESFKNLILGGPFGQARSQNGIWGGRKNLGGKKIWGAKKLGGGAK